MAPGHVKAPKGSKGNNKGKKSSPFNDAALSQLTAKIDQSLENTNAANLNGTSKRKRGADAADEDAAPSKPAKKPTTAKAHPPAQQGNGSSKKTNGGSSDDKKAIMLEEIRALGGDEADLDLVAGFDSDVEDGGSGSKGAADDDLALDDMFKGELAKFAAGLGFDKLQIEEEEEEEEGEGPEGEEDEDDEDVEEDVDENDEAAEEEEFEEPPPEPKKPAPVDLSIIPKNPKFKKLNFEPRPDWHAADLPALSRPKSPEIGRLATTIASLNTYATTLMEADAAQYREIIASSSSHRFMSTIMTSGTMSDKVSALTLEIQEAPIHNIQTFEKLMGLAAKRSRGQAIAALGALVDLLGNGVVLPSDRRLRTFHSQPALLGGLQAAGQDALVWRPGQNLPGAITKAHLIMWKYEDWLKDTYFKILQLLEVWSNDEIEYSRSRSLDFIFGLLKSKPEQEANLLRLLVNKLGDRERKIASRASYLLLQLLTLHPGMKPIVIQTIEQEVLLRPGQSMRAQYYGITTLNQTILSTKEPAIADTLVRIYFELFLTLLKSGAMGSMDIPGTSDTFTSGDTDKTPKKRRGGAGRNKHQLKKKAEAKNAGTEKDVSERLVSALLTGVNRAIPFANTDNDTLEKHIDTLFRITHSSNFNTSIQALLLMQQVAMSKQIAVDRFYRTLYESLLDPRLLTSSKPAMYLNLLFKSLKNDVDVRRVKAFVKRMLQIATLHHQPSFACGILFMVAELETSFPDIKTMINDPEMDDDEEEVYHDVVEGGAGEEKATPKEDAETPKASPKIAYDGRKRAPEYSNAQLSCLWELVPYFAHFHPTVRAFAQNLLERQTSLPKPDMANHTLMHFLDKFVYRNPKAADGAGKQRGVSIMQPVAGSGASASGAASSVTAVNPGKAGSGPSVSVNSATFWSKKAEDVAAEDVFFHTYFAQVGKSGQTSRAAKRAAAQEKAKSKMGGDGDDEDEDDDDQDSDAEEDEIWQALKASRPEVDADNEDVDMDMDDDEDMSGLEDLLNDSEDDMSEDDGLDGQDLAGGGDDSDGVEFADFSEDDEEGGAATGEAKAKKLTPAEAAAAAIESAKSGSKLRRKQLKALPTFASIDDYAEMLGEEADEDYR